MHGRTALVVVLGHGERCPQDELRAIRRLRQSAPLLTARLALLYGPREYNISVVTTVSSRTWMQTFMCHEFVFSSRARVTADCGTSRIAAA